MKIENLNSVRQWAHVIDVLREDISQVKKLGLVTLKIEDHRHITYDEMSPDICSNIVELIIKRKEEEIRKIEEKLKEL